MKFTRKNTLSGLIFFIMSVLLAGGTVTAEEMEKARLPQDVETLVETSRQFSEKIHRQVIDVAVNAELVPFLKQSSRSEESIQNFSEKLIRATATYPFMLNISLLDEGGVVVASSVKDLIGFSEFQEEFPEGFAGKPFLASPFLSNRGGGMTLGFAPVKDADKVYGTVVCAFSLAHADFATEPFTQKENKIAFALNNEGLVVWRPDEPNLLYRKWSDAELALYKKIVAAGSGHIDAVNSQGVSSRFQFKTDELLKMTIVVQAKK